MTNNKVLTQDQIDQLDTFTADFIESGDDLKLYLEEIISKRNPGHGIVGSLCAQITTLQGKIYKLSHVAELNNWEVLADEEVDDGSDYFKDNACNE